MLDQHVATWLLLEEPADSDAIARFQELTRSRAEALRLLSGLKQLLPQRD